MPAGDKKSAKESAQKFSEEERAAMRQRAKELKAGEEDGDSVVREKIAEMTEPDRTMAERLHAIIRASAPDLAPRLWYGMPAYATAGKNGKIVCFFQPASKFKTRYATLGFNDSAHLDDGAFWPVAYALTELSPADEARIGALVKQAAS